MSYQSGSAQLADAMKKKADELEGTPTPRPAAQRGVPAGAPAGTVGGVVDTPGFSLSKAIRFVTNQYDPSDEGQFKHEVEGARQFRKALAETQFLPSNTESGRSLLIPLASHYLPEATQRHDGYRVIKGMMQQAVAGYDPDEAAWLIRKSQSYLVDNIGGTLVPPPQMGEFIELMRPNQALVNAGVTQVPLPPQGKVSYPRQTSPSTMYWVGDNASITESQAGTGQVNLQAKKGGVFMTVPNELLKYASVAADAMLRADISKTLALGLDYAGLYGTGSYQPGGLSSFTGTNQLIAYESQTPAPKGVGTDGNTLRPEDGYRMVGLIEDRSFEFTGWIMRPTLANNVAGFRSDAVAPGDAAGVFVQNLTRAIGDRLPVTQWCGYKVTKSATVKNTLTKGAGTALTDVFGGAWNHFLLGMYGAVELAASNQAGNSFQNDQTYLRGLIWADSSPRYEGAFVKYTSLKQTN